MNMNNSQLIKAQRARAAHTRLTGLMSADVASALAAGQQLDAIRSEDLWVELGATTWRDYVEKKLGVTTGWAANRIAIHHHFGDENTQTLPSLQKLIILARLFRNPTARGSKRRWLDRAVQMTCPQLMAAIGHSTGNRQARSNWGVSLSNDERTLIESAIARAQESGATTVGNALAMVAEAYLGAPRRRRSA